MALADASETNEAAFASYNCGIQVHTRHDLDEFNTRPIPTLKVLAFNFFPDRLRTCTSTWVISATTITSDDEEAYNPRLLPLSKYANIVNFTTGGQNVTFEAGKSTTSTSRSNRSSLHTDLNPVAYNITLTITIADWVKKTSTRSSNSCSNPLITGGGRSPLFTVKTAN